MNISVFYRGFGVASFLLLGAPLSPIATAQPTTTPVVAAPAALPPNVPAARAPIAQHIEGRVSVEAYGSTQIADVIFSAPDSLFVHIQPNTAKNTPDEIYIARGTQQTTYNATSRRVRRWNWSSAQQPWRSRALADGGPANIALWGWNPQAAGKFYSLAAVKNEEGTTVTMTAKSSGRRSIYDVQRSGGRGDRVLFAVSKRTIYNWPRTVILKFDANDHIVSQERRDERNRVLDKTTISWNGDLPATAITRDANNFIISSWKYDLKAAKSAPDATTFNLNAATENASKNQIVEDAELQPIAVYAKRIGTTSGVARATAFFNLGVAQRLQSEDVLAARTNLESAAKLQPQAVAPVLELFDLALQTRDVTRAKTALKSLETLIGASDVALLDRRVELAYLQRDWETAQTASQARADANPDNASTRLSLARLQLMRGQLTDARRTFEEILALDTTTKPIADQTSLFTTPQSSAQATAAILWAASLLKDEAATALKLPSRTPAQQLARALFSLRNGVAESYTTRNKDFLAALAQARAESGQWSEAISARSTIASQSDVYSSTRAHRVLISLGAAQGNIAKSLQSFWIVMRREPDEESRSQTRRALFEAWRRNLRGDMLRRALEQRSVAQNSTEDEARLWLAWQESYGTPEMIGTTVRNMAAKYRQNAWWQSRLAEQLINEAEPLKKDPQGRGIRLTREALAAIERAIALDKTQSYYAVQRAFILTFRANDLRKSGVSDATETVNSVNAAQAALDDLRKKYATDPEVAISIAAAQQALSTRDDGAIAGFKRGLEGGLPGRSTESGERHNTTFAARQALAIALRRQKKWGEAATQYDTLLASSLAAEEQAGIAVNYIVLARLSSTAAPEMLSITTAQLLKRLCSEAWTLDAADANTRNFAMLVQNDATLWPAVINVLRRESDENAHLALAYLLFSIQSGLTNMQSAGSSESQAYVKSVLKQIEPYIGKTEENLAGVANSDNAILAARAHVLLADRALARREYSNAQTHLQNALAIEPDNTNLRLAQVRAFLAAGQSEEASQALDVLQQTQYLDAPTLSSLSKLLAQTNRDAKTRIVARELLERAWRVAQIDGNTSSQDAQRIAYALARSRVANEETAEAAKLYEGLNDASWTRLERAAALLDWENQLRTAGKISEADAIKKRREALSLSPVELQTIRNFVDSL